MIEKVGPIKNPLTIIAIFAAIAEISGTVVLPFISENNQGIYVWFLIVFPITLILFFFLTLNFNHKVLYAPSDYANEENFVLSLPRGSALEKSFKIDREIADLESGAFPEDVKASEDVKNANSTTVHALAKPSGDDAMLSLSRDKDSNNNSTANDVDPPLSTLTPTAPLVVSDVRSEYSVAEQNLRSLIDESELNEKRIQAVVAGVRRAEEEKRQQYLLLEKLAVDRVAKGLSGELQRDIKIGPGGALVDGVVAVGNEVKILEVAIVRNVNFTTSKILEPLRAIHNSAQNFFGKEISYKIVLILVFEEGMENNLLNLKIASLQAVAGFPFELRLFSRDMLLGNIPANAG